MPIIVDQILRVVALDFPRRQEGWITLDLGRVERSNYHPKRTICPPSPPIPANIFPRIFLSAISRGLANVMVSCDRVQIRSLLYIDSLRKDHGKEWKDGRSMHTPRRAPLVLRAAHTGATQNSQIQTALYGVLGTVAPCGYCRSLAPTPVMTLGTHAGSYKRLFLSSSPPFPILPIPWR